MFAKDDPGFKFKDETNVGVKDVEAQGFKLIRAEKLVDKPWKYDHAGYMDYLSTYSWWNFVKSAMKDKRKQIEDCVSQEVTKHLDKEGSITVASESPLVVIQKV